MLQEIFDVKRQLDQQGIFFCFNGPISQELVTDIGEMLSQKMRLEMTKRTIITRVFSVIIENAQNILHYSDAPSAETDVFEDMGEYRHGFLAIGHDQEHYWVISGNMIDNKKVDQLRKNLTKLQQMSKVELKHYYLEQRRKPMDEKSKGAGLGFIEMARKASRPLEFTFTRLNDTMSFFSLKIVI